MKRGLAGLREMTGAEEEALHAAASALLDQGRSFKDCDRKFRRVLLEVAVDRAGGNRTHAARALGIARPWMNRLIADLGADTAPTKVGRPAEAVGA